MRARAAISIAALLGGAGSFMGDWAIGAAQAAPMAHSWVVAGDAVAAGSGAAGSSVAGCARSRQGFGVRAARLLATDLGWRITRTGMVACAEDGLAGLLNAGGTPRGQLRASGAPAGVLVVAVGGADSGLWAAARRCSALPATWGAALEGDGVGCRRALAAMDSRIDRLESSALEGVGPAGISLTLAEAVGRVSRDHLGSGGVGVVVGPTGVVAAPSGWPHWRNGRCGALRSDRAERMVAAGARLDRLLADAVERAGADVGADLRYLSAHDVVGVSNGGHLPCGTARPWVRGTAAAMGASFLPTAAGHERVARKLVAMLDADPPRLGGGVGEVARPGSRPAPRTQSAVTPSARTAPDRRPTPGQRPLSSGEEPPRPARPQASPDRAASTAPPMRPSARPGPAESPATPADPPPARPATPTVPPAPPPSNAAPQSRPTISAPPRPTPPPSGTAPQGAPTGAAPVRPARTITVVPRPPAATPSASGDIYRPGELFGDRCAMAPEIAPRRGPSQVILEMACAHLPEGYAGARVLFPSPHLPITPRTGVVQVDGRVSSVERDAQGRHTLVVVAHAIGPWEARP